MISECLSLNIGSKIGFTNMSVSAFADDNFLLSPSVSHLQKLLDICADYACKWKIKFNYKKSKIICFGNSYFKKTFFHMNNLEINSVESLTILGFTFNRNNLKSDKFLITKFNSVRKSFFSLHDFGLRPEGLNPFLQGFIYKTFCLSRLLYSIENMCVSLKTLKTVNTMQNNLIRYALRLRRNVHMSFLVKSLKLENFKDLFFKHKLSFLYQVKGNYLTKEILKFKVLQSSSFNELSFKKTASVINDFKTLCSILETDITSLIDTNSTNMKLYFDKINFDNNDGLSDSIKLCLSKYDNLYYKSLLVNLIKV